MSVTAKDMQSVAHDKVVVKTVEGALSLFEAMPPEDRVALKEMLNDFLDCDDAELRSELAISIIKLLAPSGYFDAEHSVGLDEWLDADSATRQAAEELRESKRRFAEKLTLLLAEKKWTQEQLADRLGVTQPTISQMTSGRHKPQPKTLQKLAEVFDVAIHELWSG